MALYPLASFAWQKKTRQRLVLTGASVAGAQDHNAGNASPIHPHGPSTSAPVTDLAF